MPQTGKGDNECLLLSKSYISKKENFKKVIQIIMDEFNKGQTGNECQKNDAKLSLAGYSLWNITGNWSHKTRDTRLEDCGGSQARAFSHPNTGEGSRKATPIPRVGKLHDKRIFEVRNKGGSHPSAHITRGLCLECFSPKKGQATQTNSRSSPAPQVLHTSRTLQDGGNPFGEGPST